MCLHSKQDTALFFMIECRRIGLRLLLCAPTWILIPVELFSQFM